MPGICFPATRIEVVLEQARWIEYQGVREAAYPLVVCRVPGGAQCTEERLRSGVGEEGSEVRASALRAVAVADRVQQIRDGGASVVVGPRSAVFAPTRKLGLIIVDEEHEPTYKQDTVPRYHGRDVAVKRAALAQVPIVLGSATPSLETLNNVNSGRYERLRLANRVRGLSMPKLEVVHLRKELQPGRVELIGKTLTVKMAATLDRNEQVSC